MRIATKLILGSTIGMLLVLSLHAVLTFRRESDRIAADRRQDGERLAHAIALAVGREWDQSGKDAALALLHDVAKRDSDIQLSWIEPTLSGAGHDDLPKAKSVTVAGTGTGALGDFFISRFHIPAKEAVLTGSYGAIQVSQDLSEDRAHVRESLIQLGTAVFVILGLNALLAILLNRRWIGQPVAKLFSMAQQVGEGNLASRSSLTSKSGREFAELGDALNTMATRLQETQAASDAEMQMRVAAEAQLRHAERLTTVGKLAAGVAHEIGTPLNVITGHADMIRRGQVDRTGAKESAELIAMHASRIVAIVNQLLGFVRRKGPDKSMTDMCALCADALSFMDSFARQRGVDLVPPRGDKALMASVDFTQMEQVLTNLVTNGVQATQEGGKVCVHVEQQEATPPRDIDAEPGQYICIRVSDTGHGISRNDALHVFEPFFTTKDVGQGTGLGLSVAYGIVQDHGGWIELSSTRGEGTTFSVFVPWGGPS